MNSVKRTQVLPLLLFSLFLLLLSDVADAQAIYATRTGHKYHLAGCRHLRQSMIQITPTQARQMNLGPCKHCRPPVFSTYRVPPQNSVQSNQVVEGLRRISEATGRMTEEMMERYKDLIRAQQIQREYSSQTRSGQVSQYPGNNATTRQDQTRQVTTTYTTSNPRAELEKWGLSVYTGIQLRSYTGYPVIENVKLSTNVLSYSLLLGLRIPLSRQNALLLEGEFGSLSNGARDAMANDLDGHVLGMKHELWPRWQIGGTLWLLRFLRLGVSYGGFSFVGTDMSELHHYQDEFNFIAITPGLRVEFGGWGIEGTWSYLRVESVAAAVSEAGFGLFFIF
ncbi:hypothetical protein KQI65_16035 [bacterium]|nr:hypothetical protein [bacterium]